MARRGLQGRAFGFHDLANPGIFSIPLGFVACWLGAMLSREEPAACSFDELYVRSETGLGAEGATGLSLTGGGARRGAATAATAVPPPL